MKNTDHTNLQITTALGTQGLEEQPWWVEQWMELINSYRFKKRLERAWIYAREGKVTSIRFEGRRVHARVQGTGQDPYKVKLWLDVLNDVDWLYVEEALTEKARWSAQLLAGIMPRDIERAFAASGKRLFPFRLEEIRSECNCPDQANPCKHISAIYFLMGERFREDPFVLFQLRGRSRGQLLQDLGNHRKKAVAKINKNKSPTTESNKANARHSHKKINPHPAIQNASMWWSYKGELNEELVVITSAIDENSSLTAAGELPLAEDPQFPHAKKKFLTHLKQQSILFSHQAMIEAMHKKK